MIDTTKPISAVKYNGQELPMQGAVITDGVVVKARDADGRITEIDYYKSDGIVGIREFATGTGNWPGNDNTYSKLQKVNFKTPITTIKDRAFQCISLTEIPELSNVTTLGVGVFYKAYALKNVVLPSNIKTITNSMFLGSGLETINADFVEQVNGAAFDGTKIVNLSLPRCTYVDTASYAGTFCNCAALMSLQIGSVGYGLSRVFSERNLNNVTQTGLTITVYVSNGGITDTLVQNIRNGATNATIIIKASEDTTYNDTAYSAGDTIITSTVEAAS